MPSHISFKPETKIIIIRKFKFPICKTPQGGPTCAYELLTLSSVTRTELLLPPLTESRAARPRSQPRQSPRTPRKPARESRARTPRCKGRKGVCSFGDAGIGCEVKFAPCFGRWQTMWRTIPPILGEYCSHKKPLSLFFFF